MVKYCKEKGIPFRRGLPSQGGDNKEQMQAIVEKWQSQHLSETGEMNRTERLCADKGMKVVYTPPYHPELQPIELLWSTVKGASAQEFAGNRTMSELKDQLLGEFRKWGQPEDRSKLIRKAMEFEEEYRKSDHGIVMPASNEESENDEDEAESPIDDEDREFKSDDEEDTVSYGHAGLGDADEPEQLEF